MLRAARPPQNFLLQLLFNSFSLFFHLDCPFAGSLEKALVPGFTATPMA